MFKDKIVVVTGGASGIGKACVEEFARLGGQVILVDINHDKALEAQKELKSKIKGSQISTQLLDISNPHAVKEFFASLPRVDVLVNNAGIIHTANFLDLELHDFDRVLDVNLRGSFIMGQEAARKMKDNNIHGAIVNVSSVNAVMAIGNQVPYVVSKGALNQLTKVMALSLVHYGIRVNGVGPGSILTDLLKVVMTDEAARKKILSRTPMGRCGEPEEIAKVVRFLASDDASYMTGQTIYADGGRLALNYTM